MRSIARRATFCGLLLLAGAHAASAGEALSVVIDNLDFSPAAVTIHVGDTVTWINRDIVEHTATARSGEFDVVTPLGKAAHWRWRASKLGEFAYLCRLHPNMTGVIRVTR
jgi:plastocyanin